MLKYTLKRIGLAFLTAFIILSLSYLLINSLPPALPMAIKPNDTYGYYVDQVNLGFMLHFNTEQTDLGDYLFRFIDTEKQVHYFYMRPLLDRYFSWIGNIILHGDWGRSTKIELNSKAMDLIRMRLPVSVLLNFLAAIVSVPLGIGLGILAGLKKNTWIDHLISTLVMVFISIPSFIIITFMMWILAYRLKWLPSQWPGNEAGLKSKALAFIIPVTSLSFGSVCGYTRFVRAELCEVMSSEYLLLARTKGLTRQQAITRHALRNAFVPILPSILAEVIALLGGSMILERLYGIPGIGSFYIDALDAKDYNVLMVDMAVFTIIGLLAGIVLDLSYGFIDPRIRMGAKK